MAPPSIPSAVVTGGTGNVGEACARLLQSRYPECKITVLDISVPVPPTSSSEEVDYRYIPGVIYEKLDITNRQSVSDVILKIKPTLVIHSAGIIPSVPLLLRKPSNEPDMFEVVNVEGTRNLLDATKVAGTRAFVYTSSADVVKEDSWQDVNYINEDQPYPETWDSPYSKSKAMAETLVLSSASSTFFTAAIRPHAVFGPHDTNIVRMWHSLLAVPLATRVQLLSGNNPYDFSYIENCALGHILAAENLLGAKGSSVPTASGKAFFITDEDPIAIRDMLFASGKDSATLLVGISFSPEDLRMSWFGWERKFRR